ncbi:MAG: metallophosphoesterase [Ruminococcus sp.]|nr:metallophosphoesterase [Ruminococcus sp.]
MIPVILSIAAALVLFFLIVMYLDCHRLVISEYDIDSKKINGEYTFVLLSDLHNKSFGENNEKLLEKIDALAPDAVLAAGDMLTAFDNGDKCQIAAEFMKNLAGRYPVYYGMGNHEHRIGLEQGEYRRIYDSYMESLHECGIDPLINESVYLPSANIAITGLQVDRCYYRKFSRYPMPRDYLEDLLGKPKRDALQILIAHNPDYFEDYAKWGADLVVAGHVHGGLMRLPLIGGVISPKLTLFPTYDGGRFEQGDTMMIVSRGLGTHTLPIRIFNPGELVVLRLHPKRK